MPSLSLCMIVKNEELLLAQALGGMREWVDECVVVDTGSTDRTVAIAREAGAEVFQYGWDGSYGRARNEYLRRATGDWVLVLDGDERIADSDRRRIRPLLDASGVSAYTVRVHGYTSSIDLLNNWHPNTGDYPEEERFSGCRGSSRFDVVRLFRRAPGVVYEEGPSSHTNPLQSLVSLGGDVRPSGLVIHHFQHLKGGDGFVADKQWRRLENELRHLAVAPDHFLAHLNIGRTLFALGRDEEALPYLTRAIALDGPREQAHFARAILLFETGHFSDAGRDLDVAVRLKPDFADAWVVLGMAYHEQGDLTKAAEALQTALQHHPAHPLAHNSLGVVYMDSERLVDAEEEFRRALAILPEHPSARENLASLCERRGNVEASGRVSQSP